MDTLDADGKRLGIEGRYAERDIVQVSSLLITLMNVLNYINS